MTNPKKKLTSSQIELLKEVERNNKKLETKAKWDEHFEQERKKKEAKNYVQNNMKEVTDSSLWNLPGNIYAGIPNIGINLAKGNFNRGLAVAKRIALAQTDNVITGGINEIKNNYAMGGNLTEFNEGGTHEQNPLGGIPIGQNASVEQGESKKGNFVYSDRIPINEDIAKEFNLPSYIKNKTAAEASKLINNKFKDRSDKYSNETKTTLLDRLAEAQETIKAQEEALNQSMQSNQQVIPDQMNGEIPQGMEEFVQPQQMFLGGDVEMKENINLPKANPSDYLGAGLGALQLGQLSQGTGASTNPNATALDGTLKGAQTGMAFGVPGMIGGAVLGLGAGILGGQSAQREEARRTKKQAITYNKGVSGEYAYGGPLEGTLTNDELTKNLSNQYLNSFDFNKSMIKPTNTIPQINAQKPTRSQLTPININGLKQGLVNNNQPITTTSILDKTPNVLNNEEENQPFNWKNTANQVMRLSPILSNWAQLKGLKSPNPVVYSPLRNTYQYDPIDEAAQERIISQESNKQLAAIGQAGASQGAMRNAITSVGLVGAKARAAAARAAESENRTQRIGAQQSQLGVNQYNNQLVNKGIDETRMDQGNYDTQKSKFIGQIGSDLGEVGKEQVYRDKVGQLFGYDENGKYLLGPSGKKIRVSEETQTTTTDSTESTKLTPQQLAYLKTMPKAFGGYITRKKY